MVTPIQELLALAKSVGALTLIDGAQAAAHTPVDVQAYEASLVERLAHGLSAIEGVYVLGSPARRASAVSFIVEGHHPSDLAMLLDQYGVAVPSVTTALSP